MCAAGLRENRRRSSAKNLHGPNVDADERPADFVELGELLATLGNRRIFATARECGELGGTFLRANVCSLQGTIGWPAQICGNIAANADAFFGQVADANLELLRVNGLLRELVSQVLELVCDGLCRLDDVFVYAKGLPLTLAVLLKGGIASLLDKPQPGFGVSDGL
jgi:hypothetical protein